MDAGLGGPTRVTGVPGGVQGDSARILALEVFDEPDIGSDPPRLFAGGDGFDSEGSMLFRLTRNMGVDTWERVSESEGDFLDDKSITALRTFDDGTGEALFLGGDFLWNTNLDCTPSSERRNFIAKWDGDSVDPIGNYGGVGGCAVGGGPSITVTSLTVLDIDGASAEPAGLFIGGTFLSSGTTGCSGMACAGTVSARHFVRWGEAATTSITDQPDVTIINDSSTTVTLSVTASADYGTLSYQWYKRGAMDDAYSDDPSCSETTWDALSDTTGISGSTTASLQLDVSGPGNQGDYFVQVTNSARCGCAPPLCSRQVSVFCLGDANRDAQMIFGDINEYLNRFGNDYGAGASGVGDADGNGVVVGADLNAILANWGLSPCPD